MKKLLVTGAGGFLGWNVCRELSERWKVTAVMAHSPAWPGVEAVRADLTQKTCLLGLLDILRPDAVIHLAALSAPNTCEEDPELSHLINVEISERLAKMCAKRDIPLAFTSSSQVFDGTAQSYDEGSPVSPVNTYGRHKAEAERRVLAEHPRATVCRVPLMFGPAGPRKGSFLQQLLKADEQGRELRLFSDEYRCFLSGRDAAQGLELALESEYFGLLHIAGPQCLSRLEFGRALEQALGRRLNIVETRQADVDMAAQRPPRLNLRIDLARTLGFSPGNVLDELRWSLAHPFAPLPARTATHTPCP